MIGYNAKGQHTDGVFGQGIGGAEPLNKFQGAKPQIHQGEAPAQERHFVPAKPLGERYRLLHISFCIDDSGKNEDSRQPVEVTGIMGEGDFAHGGGGVGNAEDDARDAHRDVLCDVNGNAEGVFFVDFKDFWGLISP